MEFGELARILIPSTKCLSVIGFDRPVGFDEAAIVWASFYYAIFKEMVETDSSKMEREAILRILRSISRAFNVPINYFSRSERLGYKMTYIGRPRRKRKNEF